MNILLDTHAFIWWVENDASLSRRALQEMQDTSNTLHLSLVSVWELQIKIQLGKFSLSAPLTTVIQREMRSNILQLLPITVNHVFAPSQLPFLPNHRDPFDRLLVAQAIQENMTLISNDPLLKNYPVQLIC